MKHFVLVHGICFGAWCWYKLVALLKQAGHRATAIDLGANPSGTHDIKSMSDYLQPLMEFLGSVPDDEKVILVGHSYGGLSISLAMEKFPAKISSGVFVTAYMPQCTEPPAVQIHEYFKRSSAVSSMDCEFTFDQGLQNPPSSVLFGPDYISTHLYKHCQKEDAELAKMLIRRSRTYFDEMTKDSLLTETNYGSITRVYVICEEDEIVPEEFQKFVMENNPPLEVMSVARAGHMVMISQPAKLSFFLQQIATKQANPHGKFENVIT